MRSQLCAIYARFSSDRQRPTSIEDQIRKCREYALRQGWQILEEHVYTDAAVSGTSTDRGGLQELLAAATGRSRSFDCVLIDDSSRLTRRLADALSLYERLTFCGVRVIAVSQGVDTDSPQAELLVGVHGLIDAVYSRDLGQKTHRGLEGRALLGFATGGRCFGYRSVRQQDGSARLEIKLDEASTVTRIFQMYADGYGLKRIAHRLNSEKITSPQPQRGRPSRSWASSSVRSVLYNEKYTGRVIWNRSRKVRVPGTGRTVHRPRPKDDWVCVDAPHLQIVAPELWNAVRRRMSTVHQLWGRECGHPGLATGQQRSVYLFSGLLRCGSCGGPITLVGGRYKQGIHKYGCSMHFQRGEAICKNGLTIRRDHLEHRLLSGLQEAVLRDEVIEHAVRQLQEGIERSFSELDGELEALRDRKLELEIEISRLVRALAAGHAPVSITSAIGEREDELKAITDKLLGLRPSSLGTKVNELRSFAMAQLSDLRLLLAKPANVHEARALLAEQFGKITLEPTVLAGHEAYIAKGSIDFFGGETLRVVGAEGRD